MWQVFKTSLIGLPNFLDLKKHICHVLKFLKHGVAVDKTAIIIFVHVLKEKGQLQNILIEENSVHQGQRMHNNFSSFSRGSLFRRFRGIFFILTNEIL
jgi:hypothetical protein